MDDGVDGCGCLLAILVLLASWCFSTLVEAMPPFRFWLFSFLSVTSPCTMEEKAAKHSVWAILVLSALGLCSLYFESNLLAVIQ